MAAGIPIFKAMYKPPSCFDGVKDGDETGVDCGGSCRRLCPGAFMAPIVPWTRMSETAPGLYNVAAYIINPNTGVEAQGVPYKMILYDAKGIPVAEADGSVTLPPGRNTLAFQAAVNAGKNPPIMAMFQFTAAPEWFAAPDALSALSVTDKRYSDSQSGSSLSVFLKNNGPEPMRGITVYAVLYDKDGNVADFSKTILDYIPAGGSVTAPFTWPESHAGRVVSIEVLPVAQ